ncbi:carboxypeptidase-like regulatory domain-containing protein [Micromonospora sp. NPDC023956]|uniref:carboxypeptidase-like regulatory domain-containing protein n=1 Tax=Micromonospora sp. NPDC023956 TaxID=3155722 RepID=UPI0033CAAD03
MKILRATGAAVAALALIPLLAAPAAADTAGYTGLVSDTGGTPIAGACLALHTTATEVAAEFCTDANGRYTISGVPTGVGYKIRTYADGFRTRWWHDEPDHHNAETVWIPTSSLVDRDLTLGQGAGTIRGRITDPSGTPADATVTVRDVGGSFDASAYTWDLGDGRYEIGNLAPGQYRISVYDNFRGTQWFPQKETQDDAGLVTVTDGGTVVADEQWLPLGVVEATVTDAVTGQPVPRPCLYVHSTPNGRQACGTNGTVRVDEVPPGWWEVTVSGGASYVDGESGRHVDVLRGQVVRADTALAPATAAVTTVLDAATGAPVGGVCVRLAAPKWGGQSASMQSYCSTADGRLEIGPFSGGGKVQLYAYQPRSPYVTPAKYYGAQWVTANGGTGDQRQALTVKLLDQRTVTVPPIRMDPPGAISGMVRNATTGAAVSGICTYPYAFHPGQGNVWGPNCSNAQGRYTISDLGPYRWPVEFAPTRNTGYAWQWSGDVADRFSATLTQVTTGATAAMDANLVAGGSVTGTVTEGGTPLDGGYVWTYNATTGDIASPSFVNIGSNGTFTIGGHRTQQVYLEYWSQTEGCWYAAGGRAATPVAVTAGASTTIAPTMTTTCARHPGDAVSPVRRAGGPLVAPVPSGAPR